MNKQYDDDGLDWDTGSDFEELYSEKLSSNDKKANKKRNIKERLDEHFERKRIRIRQRDLDDFYSDF